MTAAGGMAPLFAGDAWFDPIEAGIRERIRGFIGELLEQELTAALGGRGRHERAAGGPKGYRNGTRARQLMGSFGPVQLGVPRARMADAEGGTREWRSAALPRYARMTRQVEALVAGAYLSGTNTRRVKRALGALFKGAVGKDVVSRTWRKVRTDWDAWNRRDLADEDVVRLILDGTVVRVRLDRKATSVSLLVVLAAAHARAPAAPARRRSASPAGAALHQPRAWEVPSGHGHALERRARQRGHPLRERVARPLAALEDRPEAVPHQWRVADRILAELPDLADLRPEAPVPTPPPRRFGDRPDGEFLQVLGPVLRHHGLDRRRVGLGTVVREQREHAR